ncbi:restriction endonuclease [Shewanella sp. 1CM18E]|uniref:nSTAND3 domain-containing NTPase n=1 Tax=Shewanella sp. 1CM18E TaxID=2929169 RepID=UPI0020BE993F|nr:restriction endonuclease [Shewanella sp. 1CM18E]MCK8043928.1 restriction endonuclease [Shewanella sp. 1CM18E]
MTKVQASEVTYELHSLGWKAFQQLCATVLSEVLGQTVQVFSEVNDGGRDLAFYGNWLNSSESSVNFQGAFTIQCKHTIKPDASFNLSLVSGELDKVKKLAEMGLCDNYLIMTNAKVSGEAESAIVKAFEEINGINKCRVFSGQWISQKIRESARLRMLIPRVYGLGDLAQIVDSRAYEQANEILSSMGKEVAKFVITDAYNKSVDALTDNGFVFLLGEPASGKSMIAASLVLASIDLWELNAIKISTPEELSLHWNPLEKNQIFWVDDVFGATQLDYSKANDWNLKLGHFNAAINKGARIIFTSRTYIYEEAKGYLKESAAPVIKNSQVTIYVENLSKDEKEQILYNHIKLGNQDADFKKELKQYLPSIVSSKGFSPEVARRLGDKNFTKSLFLSEKNVIDFFEKPMDFLIDTTRNLDVHSRAALTVLFRNGGEIESPVPNELIDIHYLSRLGSSPYHVLQSLKFLEESFTISFLKGKKYFWKFKHPTIQDALANIFSNDREFLDEYVSGANILKLFREVSCGLDDVLGSKIILSNQYYGLLIDRIRVLDLKIHSNSIGLSYFLSERCDYEFLKMLVGSYPQYVSSLRVISSLKYCSDLKVLLKLKSVGLLDESLRLKAVSRYFDIAIKWFDAGALDESCMSLLTEAEKESLLHTIKSESLLKITSELDDYEADWNGEEPEEYLEPISSAIDVYLRIFNDEESKAYLKEAKEVLVECKSNLESNYFEGEDEGSSFFSNKEVPSHTPIDYGGRCVFDDVDK